MSHSHLAIRHLVRKLEKDDWRSAPRAPLPGWLLTLISDLAQGFEPFQGVARVGYEAQQGESGWEVALFLGETELVGGAEDGELCPVNFRYDIKILDRLFDALESVHWNAFPSSHVCFDDVADLSMLIVRGVVRGEAVQVQIHAGPPDSVGPGMRRHTDGRIEVT